MTYSYQNNSHNRVLYRNKKVATSENTFYLNLPNLPLLGQIKTSKFLKQLLNVIEEEATAVDFYTRLGAVAPNALHKEFIEEARSEEQKHLMMFTKLYENLTEQVPSYTITPEQYPNYKEGLLMALKDELEAADLYKEMSLSTSDAMVRDAFFYAMGDELEHSIMFSTLYNTV